MRMSYLEDDEYLGMVLIAMRDRMPRVVQLLAELGHPALYERNTRDTRSVLFYVEPAARTARCIAEIHFPIASTSLADATAFGLSLRRSTSYPPPSLRKRDLALSSSF